jgi:hypothetical protein
VTLRKHDPAELRIAYTLNGIHLTDLELEGVAFAIEEVVAIPMAWERKGAFITTWSGGRPLAEGEPDPPRDTLELEARAAARRSILETLPDLCRCDGWADTSKWPDG